jgi:hypothetical protein
MQKKHIRNPNERYYTTHSHDEPTTQTYSEILGPRTFLIRSDLVFYAKQRGIDPHMTNAEIVHAWSVFDDKLEVTKDIQRKRDAKSYVKYLDRVKLATTKALVKQQEYDAEFEQREIVRHSPNTLLVSFSVEMIQEQGCECCCPYETVVTDTLYGTLVTDQVQHIRGQDGFTEIVHAAMCARYNNVRDNEIGNITIEDIIRNYTPENGLCKIDTDHYLIEIELFKGLKRNPYS